MKRLAVLLFIIQAGFYHAQENPQEKKISKVDSLRMVINQSAQDTNAVNNRIRLLREFLKIARFDSAEKYGTEAMMLATQLNFYKGQAGGYNNMGVVMHYQGNYPKALDYYSKACRLRKALGDQKGMAQCYNNMGKIYFNQGNFPMTLECIYKALAIVEKTGDKSMHASLLNDIGNVYMERPEKAIEYYKKALAIYESIPEKQGIANEMNNLGTMYAQLKDDKKAIGYYNKALQIKEEIGDRRGLANTIGNIGGIYEEEKNYEKALEFHLKELNIVLSLGEKYAVSSPLNSIAGVYKKMGKYPEALNYAGQSLALAKEVGSFYHIREAEKSLSEIYEAMGQVNDAFKHYKLFIAARDTLYNEDNTEKSAKAEMNFEFEKQRAVAQAEQEKKEALLQAKLQKKEIVKDLFIAGFVLVGIFAFLVFRNFKQKQKANELLAAQKKEIEVQKALVEEKNHEVTDSIKYAQRIQNALLTSEQYVKKHLSDFFILSRARDIVSGDFYWFLKKDDLLYVATADCTGHGVPGAFMSMLGINFLNEIIIERNITEPGRVLDNLRADIIKALNPEGTTELTKDGMDIVLCCYDLRTMKMTYGAANNSFYLVRDNRILEQKFDKMPVGVHDEKLQNFTTYTLPLQKGDIIYTFTDGYADQFGGLKGKKFKYKQFEKLLVSNSHLPMHEQKHLLVQTHEDWKGQLQQVDDLLIIGMRV